MSEKTPQQQRIVMDLETRITRGELSPGRKLPSLRNLAKHYQTSVGTIRLVFDRLRHQGRLVSRHGKGNFLCSVSRAKTVLLIGTLEGDVWSDIVSHFSMGLSRMNVRLLLEPANPGNPILMRNRIETYLADGLDAIFFDGSPLLKPGYLAEFRNRVPLFCYNERMALNEWDCPGVFSDTNAGAYLGIRHLCEIGCRKILVITYPYYQDRCDHNLHDFDRGCRQAFSTSGQSPEQLLFFRAKVESPSYPAQFRKFFSEHPGIDGIFCFGDHRFLPLWPVFRELGIGIPDDLALLGYYNTPHSLSFFPSLSSISVRAEAITRRILDLFTGQCDLEQILVQPELVIRESTGRASNKNWRVAP